MLDNLGGSQIARMASFAIGVVLLLTACVTEGEGVGIGGRLLAVPADDCIVLVDGDVEVSVSLSGGHVGDPEEGILRSPGLLGLGRAELAAIGDMVYGGGPLVRGESCGDHGPVELRLDTVCDRPC